MNHHRILAAANAAFAADETCVLCTVVRLDGSGYGRPGARLLLTESGEREGYVSGGCLEKDLCRRVWSETERGPKLIAFDTRGNSVALTSYNTGCEGVVYVLCQRISRSAPGEIEVLKEVEQSGNEIRLLTIYRSESSSFEIGQHWTELTNTGLPDVVVDRFKNAQRCMSIEFCDAQGKTVEAAIEILQPRRRLVIFGAGDDVIPLTQIATVQGWETIVIGHRPELADSSRFPGCEVVCGPLHKVAETLPQISGVDVVVMTHDFNRDSTLLPVLLDSSARTIGLLGPKRRLGKLVEALYQRGRQLTDADIARIRSPIGLDIGAVTPEEIAVSIVAELIAMPRGRNGGVLHDRRAAVHAPNIHISQGTTRSTKKSTETLVAAD